MPKSKILALLAELAGGEGFEPSLAGPGPAVLPLDDPPVPSQNRTGIGKKIQSLLSNRPYGGERGPRLIHS